jgi:cytochrome c oxidase subunit 3
MSELGRPQHEHEKPVGHVLGPDEELPHHLSPWPIVSAFGGAILLVGLVTHPLVTFLGVIVTFAGLAGWVYEDSHFFHHPMPELFHHGQAPNPLWGVILFLGTEVVLFGALFAAYFHGRSIAANTGEAWPGVNLPVPATGLNTAILVASGATMHWAMHSIQHGNRRNFKIGLVLTLLLGATFLAQQVREYISLIHEGLTLAHNEHGSGLFGSVFYMLTGTHGFHVFGGLLAILVVTIRAFRGQFDERRNLLVETAAFYWHFVDVVWIFLFAVIYLHWI